MGGSAARVYITDGENDLGINADGSISIDNNGGPLDVTIFGKVDTNNTTTTPLGAGGMFIGGVTDILRIAIIFVSVYADVASGADGLAIQQSNDGTHWDWVDYFNILAATGKTFSINPALKYFRVVYTNGGTPQGSFRLQTVLKSTNAKPSAHRIQDSIVADDDAELIKAVIAAKRPSGIYENVDANPEGKLEVSVVTPVGTLPVSQLTTLHDGKLINRAMSEIIEVVGTGTNSYGSNKYNMAVTAGQYSVIQSRRFMPYFSGKPQKVELTFDNFAPQDNVVKRVGYFSSSTVAPYSATLDGLWLESGGGTITLKASRAGTVTLSVPITSWGNYVNLGTYQTLSNWDKFTVIEFNFLWLGGAYIELRLVTPEIGFITAHSYVYAGTAQDVFMLSPNQPVRYEISSTSGTGSFRYICNQVASSGSISESWLGKSVNLGTAPLSLASTANTYPVLAIRKGSSYRNSPVLINNVDLLITTNDTARWTLQINPTLSAGLTYAAVTNSAIDKANGDGAITVTAAGTIVASGYLTQSRNIDPSIFTRNFLAYLSGSITGTQDQYVFCVSPISSSLSVLPIINYLEG